MMTHASEKLLRLAEDWALLADPLIPINLPGLKRHLRAIEAEAVTNPTTSGEFGPAAQNLLAAAARWVLADQPRIPVNLPGLERELRAVQSEYRAAAVR